MPECIKKILVVDDDPNLVSGLRAILTRAGYAVHTANDGENGLRLAIQMCPDLILCDVHMPGISGFEMLQRLRWDARTTTIPFMFITASGEPQEVLKGFDKGADDYIVKPFDRPQLVARVSAVLRRVDMIRQSVRQTSDDTLLRMVTTAPNGMMLVDQTGVIQFTNGPLRQILGASDLLGRSLYDVMPAAWHLSLRQFLTGAVESPNESITFEGKVRRLTGEKFLAQVSAVLVHWHGESEARFTIRDLAKQKQIEVDLEKARVDLLNGYEATLVSWARALEMRDRETEGHSERVTQLTVRAARTMGLAEEEIIHIRRGALLHDIGKIGIPDRILFKPGVLTPDEWEIMRQHPQLAYDALADIEYLRPALDIPYCHHEKWDGTGYPRGLQGEAIPLAARIFAVVDVWDALISDRPYRKEWSRKATLEAIHNWAGTHFDPKVVDVVLPILKKNPGKGKK